MLYGAFDESLWDQLLTAHVLKGKPVDMGFTLLSHVSRMSRATLQQQMDLLGSVSNFHWWCSVDFKGDQKLSQPKVSYSQHMLSTPGTPENVRPKHLPASPRHQIAFCMDNTGCSQKFEGTIHLLLEYDREEEDVAILFSGLSTTTNWRLPQTIPAKKKKTKQYSQRVIKVLSGCPESLQEQVDLAEASGVEVMTGNPQRSLFSSFSEELSTKGTVLWRIHQEEENVVLMSDIDPTTWRLKPNALATITATPGDQDRINVKCTCQVYQHMQDTALLGAHRDAPDSLDAVDGVVLPEDFTCMHCRFYREALLPGMQEIFSQNNATSNLLIKVQLTAGLVNNPVVLLGDPGTTTKFSVLGNSSLALVHANMTSTGLFVKCQSGLCGSHINNKGRRIPQRVDAMQVLQQGGVCPHVHTLLANIEVVRDALPEYFVEDPDLDADFEEGDTDYPDVDVGDAPGAQADPEPLPDPVNHETKVSFNVEEGMWRGSSHSKFRATRQRHDPELVRSAAQRLERSGSTIQDNGCYTGLLLVPQIPDGCPCGAGWKRDDGTLATTTREVKVYGGQVKFHTQKKTTQNLPKNPVNFHITTHSLTMKFLLLQGVLDCTVGEYLCQAGTCSATYDGKEDHIFFLTKSLGIGEEVLFSFLDLLKAPGGRMSFSKFCNHMSSTYWDYSLSSAPFMSNKTFIDCFFSWVCNWELDFRKEIDPWCQYSPSVLACDGTHIGVSIKHLNLEEPITKPELEEVVPCAHRKMNRCLLPYPQKGEMTTDKFNFVCSSVRRARDYLKGLCHSTLKGESVFWSPEEHAAELLNLKQYIADHMQGREGLADLLTTFIERSADHHFIQCAGTVLDLLLKMETAVSTILPIRFHQHIRSCCDAVEANSAESGDLLTEMKTYAVEVSDFLTASQQHGKTDVAVKFTRELVDFVQQVHQEDRPTAAPSPQPGTYNPPSGVAYHLNEKGEKVRNLPTYKLDDHGKDKTACKKHFPQVSFGGFGYMFIFFCPTHGHCYGFHLIKGGEGRKDPFSAITKYMEEPPKDLFYDFACQLEEYCLNREPDFWKGVRFWHDLFHGVNHFCNPLHKSSRIQALGGTNSEICEQFNSFLNSIKYTGSHLSQPNFMLLTQFMMYHWNREKTSRYSQVSRMAAEGLR